ncbi:unnamed protein product [Cylicocyclus nassatus]|uniref:SXP/RAL-2 family protein Ani s 5-like cation-binding domain-containing protein n=1 Tax=Cylicocyclus nassatus TaxID=53992 RepID=A0AA36DSB6_CYLNA|nr:unnamed protein product [Cylicocyclus nassatus]
MKTIIFSLVFFGGVLYASSFSQNEKEELKEFQEEIKKELRANVTKLIGELNTALDKHIAIADDKSKSLVQKVKDLLELRKENPKAFNVLWSMFERFIPPKLFHKRYENLNETEKAEIDEKKKEVRAKIRKLIGEMSAVLDKRTAIHDDKSKTPKEKLKALLELRKENPNAIDILHIAFMQFLPRNRLFRMGRKPSKQLNEADKARREEMIKEARANVTKLFSKLNAAMDKLIAIVDDKSKTFKEKEKAIWELREQNPKEKVSDMIKEVRPNVTKLIGELSAVLAKGIAILDDNSTTLKEKVKALWELRKENTKAELEKAIEEINKEVRENVTKLIDKLNEAMEKQIAIVDDRSKSIAEKHKALWELRKQNPKARWEEIKKEARANVTKLIGELNGMFDQTIAILDDKSKTQREKLKALCALRKEDPKAYNVLRTVFEQFIPKRMPFLHSGPLGGRRESTWVGLRPRPRILRPCRWHFSKKHEDLTEAKKKARRDKMRKEARANVAKIIGELNEALDKQIAIFDDKSKTFEEKMKAFAELRKKSPKVYHVLRLIFKQTAPKQPFEKHESLSETEKAEIEKVRDEIKKEVRAKVIKIIGQLNAALSKTTAILDDKSKTAKEKLEALWALRKENPEVYDVLGIIFEESVPRFGLWRRRL